MILKGNITQHFLALQDGFINVYRNTVLYYQQIIKSGNAFYINLPFEGYYQFTGKGFKMLQKTPLIKSKNEISLPPPERTRTFGINKITVDTASTSPARIATDKGIIILNPKFFKYPVEVRMFILLHEVGHFYYKTEWKCDQYAAYHYLDMGMNKSQAFESLAGILHETDSLGNKNEVSSDRIKRIYNLLAKKTP